MWRLMNQLVPVINFILYSELVQVITWAPLYFDWIICIIQQNGYANITILQNLYFELTFK
jgi:hypothetical protein